jgi:hypothetical protein
VKAVSERGHELVGSKRHYGPQCKGSAGYTGVQLDIRLCTNIIVEYVNGLVVDQRMPIHAGESDDSANVG